jgi:hypothetical protein
MKVGELFAPSTDRTVLADPPTDRWVAATFANADLLASAVGFVQGRSFQRLRQEVRAEALREAYRYTVLEGGHRIPETWSARLSQLRADSDSSSLLVVGTGHQPELFHPGVWLKNFAVGQLAAAIRGLALNLVVDSDRVKQWIVRVPAGPPEAPQLVFIPLDRWQGALAYEEHVVADEETFRRFGERLQQAVRSLQIHPCVSRFWHHALQVASRTRRLGERLAYARRRLEEELGLWNLELPVSRLCGTDAFYWFLAHLAAQAPRFVPVYNEALQAYRLQQRIRQPARPVPDLAVHGTWWELPFWVWTTSNRQRRPVFVRCSAQSTELSDLAGWSLQLPLGPEREACCAVEVLREATLKEGVRLRPRALTTTLFVRLFLSDFFVHGLGGALYDRVTDEIIQRFYHWPPPSFGVVTATLYLPVPRPKVDASERAQLKRRLRDLLYNPERYLSAEALAAPHVQELVQEKWKLIQWNPSSRAERRQRFRQIRAVNESLRRYVERSIAELQERLGDLEHKLEVDRVLRTREVPFVAFPAEYLEDFYRSALWFSDAAASADP